MKTTDLLSVNKDKSSMLLSCHAPIVSQGHISKLTLLLYKARTTSLNTNTKPSVASSFEDQREKVSSDARPVRFQASTMALMGTHLKFLSQQ